MLNKIAVVAFAEQAGVALMMCRKYSREVEAIAARTADFGMPVPFSPMLLLLSGHSNF